MGNEDFLPTFPEFLISKARNSFIYDPNFSYLYVRKGTVAVMIDGDMVRCNKTVTIASVESAKLGKGAFRRLVSWLTEQGWAVMVECVLTEKLAEGLLRMGFTQINPYSGRHFLINHEGHLAPPPENVLKNR